MTRQQPPAEQLDDDALGRLVKDVASDWAMPAVRLDESGWRERVRQPRQSGVGAGFSLRPWLRRLGSAFGVAVVLTLAVALIGVWLTLPKNNGVGKPGESTTPPTEQPTTSTPTTGTTPGAATFTPLPALYVGGSLPSPSRLLVQVGESSFALVDLEKGEVGSAFASGKWGSAARRAPDGSLYCLCISLSDVVLGAPTHATVDFNRYDAAGQPISTSQVGEFSGQPDPRDPIGLPAQPEHVRVAVSFGSDPRYAFVGWSRRAQPVWQSGVYVIDVTRGEVVQKVDLPDSTSGEGNGRRMTDAPHVVGGSADSLIIGRSYYTWSPADANEPDLLFNADAFEAPLSGATIGDVRTIGSTIGCGDFVENAGKLADGGTWLECSAANRKTIRRLAADGTLMGDTHVQAVGSIQGTTVGLSPDGTMLYMWHPTDLTLTRVRLDTGETDTITGPAASAGTDWLTALGHWLVPSASAKMLLHAGIAVSPDGKRVYALGVVGGHGDEAGGSAGVFAFDVDGATMAAQRWNPTADYVSLTVSPDGTSVYAAGLPGVDWTGAQRSQPASVTVFDAQTGDVELIAGDLGQQMMTLDPTPLP